MFIFEKYMLQRVQTIHLLLMFIICILSTTINVPFYEIEKNEFSEKVMVFLNSSEMTSSQQTTFQSNNYLISVLAGIAFFSLISIISYKNRKLQLLLTSLNYLLIVLTILLMYGYSIHMHYFDTPSSTNFHLGIFVPLILIIFNFLAFRGIKKDEMLIRSMDRLR